MRYSDQGKGRAIVLLHGFLESMEIWEEYSERLSKTYRVITIDLPGFGETPSIGYVHTMEMMAECVKAVMDSIGCRRYAVIGHSMGGYAALAFAALFPESLTGIGIFHSTALPDTEEKKKNRDAAIKLVKQNPRHYVNAFYDSLFAPENVSKFQKEIKQLKERSEKFTREGIVNALEGMKLRSNRESVLRAVTFPVLFIIGKQDAVIPWNSVLEQTKLCKEPVVLMLENAAHMGFYEEKEKCLKAIRKFARACFSKE